MNRLKKDGLYPISQKGSHAKLKHDQKEGIIIFPNHISQELGKRLEKKVKKTVKKTTTGFSAYSEEYSIFTTVRTIPELLNNTLSATYAFEVVFI